MSQASSFPLHNENIIPFYIVQDKLKENFSNISAFIAQQTQQNTRTESAVTALKDDLAQFKQYMDQKFVTVEKSIVAEIGRELDGRIVVAINKNMASFSARMDDKEKEIGTIGTSINSKLQDMKKKILYESAKEQQKSMKNQMDKLEKKMKSMVEETKKATSSHLRPPSRDKFSKGPGTVAREEADSHFAEEWGIRIKELQARVEKIQEFMVNFDKRFYENITSLKESWKEIGEDILETKKKMTAKQDELRLELVKIKGIKEFQGAPQDIEETFKKKLMQKFADLYQLVGQLVTRTDLDSEVERSKKISLRHDNELSDLREEMARNSDYFTFYINNSNTEDLSTQIKQLKQELQHKILLQAEKIHSQDSKNETMGNDLAELGANLNEVKVKEGDNEAKLGQVYEELCRQVLRIDALQEHNNFTPQKLNKIHNTLDIQFSPTEQELLSKKESTFVQNMAIKEMKGEISKLKDELFVLTHEVEDSKKVKMALSGLEGKVEKMKVESEEALLARKPWVCLSCDKNEKERQENQRLKREVSKKKLQEGRSALFTKQKSEKLIKLVPAGEQKFQVYQKYREKYLSDAIRLPQIYRQKIGDKEPSLS